MKKINIIILILVTLSFVFGCKDPDNAVYNVLEDAEYGASLRTKERISNAFNIYDLQSTWEVVVEEQDENYGDLLSKVNVYIAFVDNTDDGIDNNKNEVLVKTVDASEFNTSPNGLPITNLSVVFQDAINSLGLLDGEYFGGDSLPIRLELVLTDGRSFSANSASSTTQGGYWSSPFKYDASILCVPLTPFTGDYLIEMQDSYGDGWNGAAVRVTIDGVSTDYTITDGLTNTVIVTVPEGTNTLVFEFISGAWDSEVTFQIYGPNTGDVIGDFGINPVPGELSLNLCNE